MTKAAQTTITLSDDNIAVLCELLTGARAWRPKLPRRLDLSQQKPDCYQRLATQRSKPVRCPSAIGLLRRNGPGRTGPMVIGASAEHEEAPIADLPALAFERGGSTRNGHVTGARGHRSES